MKTIIFLSGDNSDEFVKQIRLLGYYSWNMNKFEHYEDDVERFKQNKKAKVLCVHNPPPEIKRQISNEEMAFSICATSLKQEVPKNTYDVVIVGNEFRDSEIKRVMNIITK